MHGSDRFSTYYIIHSETSGDPCKLIGFQLCDLYTNHTIFCSKSNHISYKSILV